MILEAIGTEPPRTLRTCLLSQTAHTLTERFDLAKQLANSINFVHTLAFVHKNVRPENLVAFPGSDRRLGSHYLIGFEHVRSVDGNTFMRGDTSWEKNLYRHPDRQGPHPEEAYNMQHDIYSLGVCLLEIGLWQSFVTYTDDRTVGAPGPLLGLTLEEFRRKKPSFIMDKIVALAKQDLAGVMGELYRDVVLNCLTRLDEDNEDFGNDGEFEDADGVLVGVRYIDKTLLKLNSISV